jgi:ATP-dependent RNA helicase DHX29
MAPKKKKKPASNPARGFATVSLPSKAKIDDGASEAENVHAEAGHAESATHESQSAVDSSQPLNKSSSFQDMTADQLEFHLEDAELQNIVDRFAERSKREAARQVARIETERRTLRAQAMPLETDDWLTEGLVEEIFHLHQSSGDEHGRQTKLPQHGQEMQQDDLLVKLWTLQQVLRSLHFPHEERVLKHVVSRSSDCILSSKDYIWGLEESLDWLALHADPEELPSYQLSIPSSRPFQGEYSAPPSSSEGSRATSPARKVIDKLTIPIIESTTTATSSSTKANSTDHSNLQLASSADTDDSADDDNDPDGLVSRYVDIKLQLLKLEPEFQYETSPTRESEHEKGLKPSQVSRLRRKLETIERDILFDHDKANAQLNETLNQFRANIWTRRKERRAAKQLTENNPLAESPQATSKSSEAASDPAEAEDAVDGLLGDMFTSAENFLPKREPNAQNEDDGSVLLVDFGKWAGISPRRVLEDMCKTR